MPATGHNSARRRSIARNGSLLDQQRLRGRHGRKVVGTHIIGDDEDDVRLRAGWKP